MADDERDRLRTTSFTTLGVLAGVGWLIGWFGEVLFGRFYTIAPTVPWTSVLLLVFAAVALGGTAWLTWRAIHQQRRRLNPHQAVNRLILGKASAIAGALVAGAYVGFGMRFLELLPAALPQERVTRSAFAAGAAVLVVIAGMLLERACRIPKDEDEDQNGTPSDRPRD